MAVRKYLFSGISTSELDSLAAETCAYMAVVHPDFSKLAARIAVSNLHKETKESFKEVADLLFFCKDKGEDAALLAEDVHEIIIANAERI